MLRRRTGAAILLIGVATYGGAAGVASPARAQSREAMERDYIRDVVFLVTKAQPAHEKPDSTSKQVGSVKPTTGLLVFGAFDGWIQVEMRESDNFARGWVRGTPVDLIKGNQLTVPIRLGEMEDKQWPPSVKQDVLRGRVRIGFTKEQVEVARNTSIGRSNNEIPDKVSEETATGVTEVWKYSDAVYTFKSGKVAKITKVE